MTTSNNGQVKQIYPDFLSKKTAFANTISVLGRTQS